MVQQVCLTTTIAGTASGITVYIINLFLDRNNYHIRMMTNGLLAGFVSINACCDIANP